MGVWLRASCCLAVTQNLKTLSPVGLTMDVTGFAMVSVGGGLET